jgi:hypothetical protein
VKTFDIHLSTGKVHTITLADVKATQEWFMGGLSPAGWICTEELENFNMAHVVAIVPHLGPDTRTFA